MFFFSRLIVVLLTEEYFLVLLFLFVFLFFLTLNKPIFSPLNPVSPSVFNSSRSEVQLLTSAVKGDTSVFVTFWLLGILN